VTTLSKDDTGEHDRPDPSDLAEMFARLYDEYAPALQRYLARRIGPETADDLVAETFLAAMTGYAGYNPMQPIRPWLYGIATNKRYDPKTGEVYTFSSMRYGVVDKQGATP
jgi:RNA polymerase sigma-70 factor (ECF subfamily)